MKLIDFDIARIVSPGKKRDTILMGTEGFAAPEQFGRRQTDDRTDIYALGATLNYIITGCHPVDGIVTGELGDVVRRCMALNPDERYQNVKELEEALDKICPPERRKVCEREQEKNKKKSWRRFLPPGFRSGTIWKMILASIGYMAIINLSLTMEVKDHDTVITGIRARTQQIIFLLSQLLEIGFVFNYVGWRDTLPFLNHRNRFVRISFYVVLEFALMVIAVMLWVFMDGVFW